MSLVVEERMVQEDIELVREVELRLRVPEEFANLGERWQQWSFQSWGQHMQRP
jgi:hypothetical protein